ncbi:MAG: DMT family transporter [Lactimicrobium sp.]|uniref:DMT family transporter n=1 Tax=Lactimicrobium sp. TaxID=2563780 RepID=UPI002F352312
MKYYLSAILAIFFWSSSVIATKIAYASITPILLCLIRFAISSALMAVVFLCRKNRQHIERQDMKPVMISSILGISVYYALENVALSMTSASDASLIEASFPALTALVGLAVYRERPSRRMLAGIGASIIGVAVLTQFDPSQSSSLIGDFLLLIDGFLWGFYNYETKSISHKYDSFTLTMYQCAIGTAFFVPMLALEKPSIAHITPAFLAVLLYLSAACSLGALLLYNYGLKGMKASTAAVIMNLMPIFGVLLSWGILHETITIRKLIGGAIILLGVWVSTTREKEKYAEQTHQPD